MVKETDQKLKVLCDSVLKVIQESEKDYECKEEVLNEVGLTFVINLLSNLNIRYNGDLDLMLKNIRNNCIRLKKLYELEIKNKESDKL